jgi:hypothetical protein
MMREVINDIKRDIRTLFERTANLPTKTRGGGSSGATAHGDAYHVEAPTKAELPEASETSRRTIGFVTAGDDIGMVCTINPAGDGWHAINVLE